MPGWKHIDFIELLLRYLNYNEIFDNGKKSNIRGSNNLEANLEHIFNYAGFSILLKYLYCDLKSHIFGKTLHKC